MAVQFNFKCRNVMQTAYYQKSCRWAKSYIFTRFVISPTTI